MQIKTTMRYHFTCIKTDNIKTKQKVTSVNKDMEKLKSWHTVGWWECKMV